LKQCYTLNVKGNASELDCWNNAYIKYKSNMVGFDYLNNVYIDIEHKR